ncbi:MAG TPA: signal recognition particle-docking protein FtsY [Nanoarchaeota archaeon]|nr:signal recognition particle-docking protein FtsY [Nanoarchaeota archaeon]
MFKVLKKKLKEAVDKIVKKAEVKKISRKIEITENDLKPIIWEIQLSLLQGDVAFEVTEKIVNSVQSQLIGKSVEKNNIEEIVKQAFKKAILSIFEEVEQLNFEKLVSSKKPFLILFLGFNGAGKTTTIAKIGKYLKDKGLKVVFAAGDTFRAASIEQLEEHGKNLGINVIKHTYRSDPAAVIFDAIKHAQAKGIDVVLADTAGRAHTNANLIEELKKICRVNKPDLKILVLDSLTGNDIIEQAKMFNEAVGVDAIIFTKTDVCEKGGSILSAVYTIKKPVIFLGNGQSYTDLKPFDKNEFVEKLLEEEK